MGDSRRFRYLIVGGDSAPTKAPPDGETRGFTEPVAGVQPFDTIHFDPWNSDVADVRRSVGQTARAVRSVGFCGGEAILQSCLRFNARQK